MSDIVTLPIFFIRFYQAYNTTLNTATDTATDTTTDTAFNKAFNTVQTSHKHSKLGQIPAHGLST